MSDAQTPVQPFPLLPLRKGVLFPGSITTLPAGRPKTVAMLNALAPDAIIGVAMQRDGKVDDPGLADLHPIGTYAKIRRITHDNAGWIRIVIEGLERFELTSLESTDPYWKARAGAVVDRSAGSDEARRLALELMEQVKDLGDVSSTLQNALEAPDLKDQPGRVADVVAAALQLTPEKEAQVLTCVDSVERLKLVTQLLLSAHEMSKVRTKINDDVRRNINKHQREALLREQLRAIKKELGEEGGDELEALRKKLQEVGLPEKVQEVVNRELARMESTSEMQAERNVIRNYLELIASLPWSKRVEDTIQLNAVKEKLDADHYGVDDVKKRILEHLAVLKMSKSKKGSILCLVGPPGVGKTSLGQSIADATGRPFVRVSLGGVRDEAEVRGHRRTYVGALPGRIIHALKNVKAKNPVFLLDEIDKLGQGWMGSPEAALLEVLDPEQNATFTDHYLELPFDLSEVMFICTANSLDTLSAPLRDRLEIIELSGYTTDEKLQIARRHLLPKQLTEHGLDADLLSMSDDALKATISDYTREAGVRQLNRQVQKLCRALTYEIASQPDTKPSRVSLTPELLNKYLGKVKFFNEMAERTQVPGVATGLAWTPVGGDILFIETSRMPGKGGLEITGQLGDVMKESARAALSYVRSHTEALGIQEGALDKQDLHIHVPAGGVPKDGPSAGVTMFTAITSLLTQRRVRPDTAMTGECTLRGRVLPVGGIKEKVIAAHRAGVKRVILPLKNQRDIEDVPASVRAELEVMFAEDMSQVLDWALEAAPSPTSLPLSGSLHSKSDGPAA